MRKILSLLFKKIVDSWHTDPFVTPRKCSKLSYYFDRYLSMTFYSLGIYMLVKSLYEFALSIKIDFLSTALMALILLLAGALFNWSACSDIKAIERYHLYLKQKQAEQQQIQRHQEWFSEVNKGYMELENRLNKRSERL